MVVNADEDGNVVVKTVNDNIMLKKIDRTAGTLKAQDKLVQVNTERVEGKPINDVVGLLSEGNIAVGKKATFRLKIFVLCIFCSSIRS